MALGVELEVALAAVEAHGAKRVARIGGLGLVVTAGIPQSSRAAGKAADDLTGILARDGAIAALQPGVDRGDFAAEKPEGVEKVDAGFIDEEPGVVAEVRLAGELSLIHISEPTRQAEISY